MKIMTMMAASSFAARKKSSTEPIYILSTFSTRPSLQVSKTRLCFKITAKVYCVSDVTLVAQLSMDRLQMLLGLLEHWDGPASISLYLSDAEARQLVMFVQESPIFSRRTDIGIHVVYKEGVNTRPILVTVAHLCRIQI